MSNRLKFTPDGKYVLISDLGGNDLVVVEASGREIVKRIKLPGGAAGILMKPDGAVAYVAVGSANGLMVIDLKTWEVSGKIESGRGPDGLEVGGKAIVLNDSVEPARPAPGGLPRRNKARRGYLLAGNFKAEKSLRKDVRRFF